MRIYQQKTNPANICLVIYWDSSKLEHIKKISFNQKLFFDDVININEDTCLVRTSFQTVPDFAVLKRKRYNIYMALETKMQTLGQILQKKILKSVF